MHGRHSHENRYCNHCKRTTKHEVKDLTYNCQTCGSVKYPPRVLKREERVLAVPA